MLVPLRARLKVAAASAGAVAAAADAGLVVFGFVWLLLLWTSLHDRVHYWKLAFTYGLCGAAATALLLWASVTATRMVRRREASVEHLSASLITGSGAAGSLIGSIVVTIVLLVTIWQSKSLFESYYSRREIELFVIAAFPYLAILAVLVAKPRAGFGPVLNPTPTRDAVLIEQGCAAGDLDDCARRRARPRAGQTSSGRRHERRGR
jgi:hypothetical protein